VNLADVRDGLAARLETIDDLAVSDVVPSSIMQTPALGIGLATVDLVIDTADNMLVTYSVVLYLSRGGSDEWAQHQIDELLAEIPAAVNDDPTLGGTADWSRVVRAEVLGSADVAGNSYVVVEFSVEVMG